MEWLPFFRFCLIFWRILTCALTVEITAAPFLCYNSLTGPLFLRCLCFQIRALEKKNKAGNYAKKVKAKTRRKRHELENPLEVGEFADMWKE